jgi:hypothetical protein
MPSCAIPIVVVERNGNLRVSNIDAYTPLELSKKCKCKSSDGFEVRAEWAYSGEDADRFVVELWARDDGTAGQENKYEFPPPVDTILFFGACALVAKDMTHHRRVIPLTLEKWDKMYDFLFGGFETLANCDDDDNESDELDSIPAHRKTKDGYLKDGFVVDNCHDECDDEGDVTNDDDDDTSDDEDDDTTDDEDDTNVDDDDDDDEDNEENEDNEDNEEEDDDVVPTVVSKDQKLSKRRDKKQPKKDVLVDTSSELSEEVYEYYDD